MVPSLSRDEEALWEIKMGKIKKPKILEEAGFDFFWYDEKLQKIDSPVVEIDIQDLLWNFDLPSLEKDGSDQYDLTPWEVIKKSENSKEHQKRVESADLNYPIIIVKNKAGKWFVLDGLHRLMKVYNLGYKKIKSKIVSKEEVLQVKK